MKWLAALRLGLAGNYRHVQGFHFERLPTTVSREIVSYVSADNPAVAEKLGGEPIDQALSLESLPFRGSRIRATGRLEAGPRQLPNLLPDQGRRKDRRSAPLC